MQSVQSSIGIDTLIGAMGGNAAKYEPISQACEEYLASVSGDSGIKKYPKAIATLLKKGVQAAATADNANTTLKTQDIKTFINTQLDALKDKLQDEIKACRRSYKDSPTPEGLAYILQQSQRLLNDFELKNTLTLSDEEIHDVKNKLPPNHSFNTIMELLGIGRELIQTKRLLKEKLEGIPQKKDYGKDNLEALASDLKDHPLKRIHIYAGNIQLVNHWELEKKQNPELTKSDYFKLFDQFNGEMYRINIPYDPDFKVYPELKGKTEKGEKGFYIPDKYI